MWFASLESLWSSKNANIWNKTFYEVILKHFQVGMTKVSFNKIMIIYFKLIKFDINATFFLPSFLLSLSPSIYTSCLLSFLKWLFNWDKCRFTCSFKMQNGDSPCVNTLAYFSLCYILENYLSDHNQDNDTYKAHWLYSDFINFICT